MASSMVALGRDVREEMDENVAALSPNHHRLSASDTKAKFLIRTLPKECNPSPSPTASYSSISASTSSFGGMNMAMSPRARKMSGFSDVETSSGLEGAEMENPFDDITEEKLQKLAGKSDLGRVTSLQIAVDASKQSVEVIGELLPSLQQLRITANSTLHSFRDLGTSLHALRVLWATHCAITDLDGISALTALRQLHLQHNSISDISPLSMHDELQVVDLEANQIADVGQIEQLAFCPQLNELTLRGNPLCWLQKYRQIVANLLPQLSLLDGQPITDDEHVKLSDAEIDAAIDSLKWKLDAEASAKLAELSVHSARPISSHGRRYDGDSVSSSAGCSLSRHGSPARLDGAVAPQDTTSRDDYGSTLTHGTSIVFAGNVTSSLRRHRSESEGAGDIVPPPPSSSSSLQSSSSLLAVPTGLAEGIASDWLSHPVSVERPKTPAYESITATLDRAHEMEKHTSHDPNRNELRAWRLETAGASVVGVVPMEDHEKLTSPSSSPTKRPRSSSGKSTAADRRPNTSAGVLRNGATVREAFVESSSHMLAPSSKTTPPPVVTKRRSGSSIPSTVIAPSSLAVPTSSSRNVDILVLDEEPQHDDQHPCSPRKTARGVFTTATRAGGDWNLEEIAPKLDLESTQSFLQRSSSRKFITRGGDDDDAEGDAGSASSDSSSDTEDMRKMARQLKQRKPTAKPPKHFTKPKGFFNVAESLHAIDRWREQMEGDDASDHQSVAANKTLRQRREGATPTSREDAKMAASASQSNASTGSNTTTSASASSNLAVGLACQSSDDQIIQWMKTKHANVGEIKTRDGFRRFFRGIDEPRLARILHHVFADDEKVRRRLQLMQGFYSE